jgi:hypothetical protein
MIGIQSVSMSDQNEQNTQELARGSNYDNLSDRFQVGKPDDIDERFLTWEIRLASPSVGSNQRYNVVVKFTQGVGTEPRCEVGALEFRDAPIILGTVALSVLN